MEKKVIRTEKDVDEVAELLKQDLKKAKEVGSEGIGIYRVPPEIIMFRSELRFTFERSGIKFSGCIYEPQIIGTVLTSLSIKGESILERVANIKEAAEALGLLGTKPS